ncbi:hypothetical protein ACF0H5_005737 [Mactra antiquata]
MKLNCPVDEIRINTTYFEGFGIVNADILGVTAFDADGNKLEVDVYPRTVQHCFCTNHQLRSTVHVKAEDKYGNKRSCEIIVAVYDVCPPRFTSCPGDIYVFHDEPVRWIIPEVYENTVVYASKDPDLPFDQLYPESSYYMEYKITDIDRNIAVCSFYVHAISRETPVEQLPWQLLSRYVDRRQTDLANILIPTVVCVSLFSFVGMLIACYRLKKSKEIVGQDTSQESNCDVQEEIDVDKHW